MQGRTPGKEGEKIKLGILYINPFFLLVLMIFLVFEKPEYIGIILLSAFLHETFHIFAIWIKKGKIKAIHILPVGARIEPEYKKQPGYKSEAFIAVGGILGNAVFAVLAFYLIKIVPARMIYLPQFFFLCNVFMIFLNSLAIMPLDGGRTLYFLLLSFCSLDRAEYISGLVSVLTLLPLIGAAIYVLFVSGYNFSLLLIILYILLLFLKGK